MNCRAVILLVALVILPIFAGSAQAAQIAIIIDDLGDNGPLGERFVDLPGPVAGAFLPSSPHTERLAQATHEAGKEVIVHLPMEATRRTVTHPDAIALSDDAAALRSIVQNGLDRVPHAVGLNNHQGSALTQNTDHMQWLMGVLADDGRVFFVDSMTSGRSVGLRVARDYGIPAARRDVFLDNVRTREAIDKQFQRLLRLATARGSAVGIGHPYPETLDYLEQALPKLAAQGVSLVKVTSLLSTPGPRLQAAIEAAPTALTAKDDTLRTALSQASKQVAALQAELRAKPAPATNTQAESKLRKQLTEARADLQSQQALAEQLQRALTAAQQRNADLLQSEQAATSSSNAELETLSRTLADTRSSLRARQQQIEALQARNAAADAQQAAAARELAQAQQALEAARSDRTDAGNQLAQANQRIATLESAIARSREDNQRLRASNAELADAKQRVAQLTSASAASSTVVARLRDQVQLLETRLATQNRELNAKIAQQQSDIAALNTQRDAALRAQAASVESLNETQQSRAVLSEQLAAAQRRLASQSQRIEALRLRVSDSAIAARDQLALVQTLRAERDAANRRLERVEGERMTLAERLSSAHQDTSQIAAENRELRKRLLRTHGQPAQAADAKTSPARFKLDPGGG